MKRNRGKKKSLVLGIMLIAILGGMLAVREYCIRQFEIPKIILISNGLEIDYKLSIGETKNNSLEVGNQFKEFIGHIEGRLPIYL